MKRRGRIDFFSDCRFFFSGVKPRNALYGKQRKGARLLALQGPCSPQTFCGGTKRVAARATPYSYLSPCFAKRPLRSGGVTGDRRTEFIAPFRGFPQATCYAGGL